MIAALIFANPLWAGFQEELQEVSSLYEQNKFDMAFEKVNALLAQQPKDAQARFLKALILTEQKKIAEATQILLRLTEDYPALPEPHNNLAVLYAAQGKYEEAKASLERAIYTHPSYATTHKNLADIYAQLARQAYDKALQLDKPGTNGLSKLSMIKGLSITSKPPLSTAALQQGNGIPSTKLQVDTAAVLNKNKNNVVRSNELENKANNRLLEEQVTALINAWARAWSAKQVDDYLAFYAADFEPAGKKRQLWEQMRRSRIERPKQISIGIKIASIEVDASGTQAVAVFQQSYRSDTLKSSTVKTLQLIKQGEKWLIRSERAGR